MTPAEAAQIAADREGLEVLAVHRESRRDLYVRAFLAGATWREQDMEGRLAAVERAACRETLETLGRAMKKALAPESVESLAAALKAALEADRGLSAD